jgi:hypothetical protein
MLARSRLGFFEATKGAATAFLGANVYNVTAKVMEWSQPQMLQASAVIGVGRFILGFLVSDDYGNDRISTYLGLKISQKAMNDLGAVYQIDDPHFSYNAQFLNQINGVISGQSSRDLIFTYETLLSLAKNVASGFIGFGVLSCVLGGGVLTLPLKQIILDTTLGVAAQTAGGMILEEVMRPRMR